MKQSIATLDEPGYILFVTCEVAGGFVSRDTVASLQAGDILNLIAEPTNPHDPDAISIWTQEPDAKRLGYIPAKTENYVNKLVAAVMARLPVVCIVGVISHDSDHLRNRVRLSLYARTM